MPERIKCDNCTGDRREKCDRFYEKYVELQVRMMASFETHAEVLAPQYPGVAPEGPVLDTQSEFTEWHQGHSIRFAQEGAGCTLPESAIKENFTKVTVER